MKTCFYNGIPTQTPAPESSGAGVFAMFSLIQPFIRHLSAWTLASLFLCVFPAAAKVPIPDIRDSYGVALADFDGDGLLDVYMVGFRTLNRMLINNGDGTFRDKSISAGVGGNLTPQGIRNLELGASAVDFDNDGAVDILICGWGEALDLLKNRKDGTFLSVTRRTGLVRNVDANMGIWADLDQDGYLDLLLTNEQGPIRLYRNDHGLQFLPIPLDSAGLPADSGSQGALWSDLDLDGDQDLIVAGWHHPLRIYEQFSPFRFKEVNLGLALPDGMRCNAVLSGDFDKDGDPDLLITVRQGTNLLLVNEANPPLTADLPANWRPTPRPIHFLEQGQTLGLKDTLDSYGGAFGDFDGDGDLDIFLTTRTHNYYYENHNSTFLPRPLSDVGMNDEDSRYNTGFMFGDLTPAPGDERVIISRDSASTILEGPKPASRQLKIVLRGVQSNRNGIGSRIGIWAESPDSIQGSSKSQALRQAQTFEIHGGSGYLSSYVGPLTVFLPDSQNAKKLSVRFPSGKTILRNIGPSDTLLEVWEAGPVSVAWERGSRAVYNALRDPVWRRKILLILLAITAIFVFLRALVKALAGNIARKQYTKELVEKNRELNNLIEEVKHTQQQLIHSEKLAGLGQLVAGIAHELNNPIGFIYANLFQIRKYLDTLEKRPMDPESLAMVHKIDQALRESQEGSIRIRDIVQNLRGLSRAGTPSPGPGPGNVLHKRPCDILQLLDKTLLLAQTGFSKNIRITKDYAPIPLLEADETQIQQVFLNLFVNAGQAMGENGTLRIHTHIEQGQAVISIADDGPGITAENLPRLFEPFFTTKPVGQGIGLGLHICYQILTAHQGKIEARPARAPAHGAEFLITLPLPLSKEPTP